MKGAVSLENIGIRIKVVLYINVVEKCVYGGSNGIGKREPGLNITILEIWDDFQDQILDVHRNLQDMVENE